MSREIEGVTITYSSKYGNPKQYMQLNLSHPDFRGVLEKFNTGEASMKDTARALIHLLFERDFTPHGEHWSRDGIGCKLIKEHESGAESYDCEETADWDWKDINAQARSHAIITLSADRKRIRLDSYSYYCAG